MEPPFDDDDLGPYSRSRSNTWPRLARAPPPQPDTLLAPCYPEHDVVPAGPGVRPGGGGAMDVILEDVVDDPAAPTSAKAAAKPRNAWGNASYADLIAEAITTAPERRLTLSQIYRWMEEHVPYFRSCSGAGSGGSSGGSSSAGWKNSVRHNLSLLDRFVRVQNEDKGQSSWWTVDPDAKPGRGSRTRRRAASMEVSKTNEQRRSRVLERVKSLRRAKQQPQGAAAAADAAPAGPGVPGRPTCPTDQLAGSLRQYMALGEDARAAYLAQSLASASNPGDSTTAGGGPGSGARCSRQPQARCRSGMAAAAVPEDCYGGREHHSAPMYAHQAVGQGRSAPPSRPPSPPLYQQLPTILQSASDASSGPRELPTVLPRRQAPLPPYASPPAYRPPPRAPADDYPPYQPTADPPAAVYHDVYQPVYQPLQSATPQSSPYHYQPQCGQPYEPQPASDDLGLPFTVDGGLNCDVEAVLRQELILEGNLDFNFNFSQPQPQPSLSYGTAYVSHSLVI